MNSQLYTAASGLLVEERRLEVISNNLANVSTGGFRAQRAFSTLYESLAAAPAGSDGLRQANRAVALAGTFELPGPGPLTQTGRPLDVALGGDGMLVVETANGLRYTRDGSLSLNDAGELIDGAGRRVLDPQRQPISGLTPAARLQADGSIRDGQAEIGRLAVVRDPGGVLRPEGSNLYTADGNDAGLETVAEPELMPGTIEGSATEALGEMVRLIESQRAFEGYQRLITMTMRDVNRRTVNDIAG